MRADVLGGPQRQAEVRSPHSRCGASLPKLDLREG